MLPTGCLGYSGNSYPPRWSFHYLQIGSCLLLQRGVVYDSISDSKEFNGHCLAGKNIGKNFFDIDSFNLLFFYSLR